MGGVGLSAIMAARVCKASPIIVVDVLDQRLEMAKNLGASETINGKDVNAVEAIQQLTGGGVDYGFECIGRADTIRQTVDATRVGGTAVISGLMAFGSEVTLDGPTLIMKNLCANVEGGSIPDLFIPRLVDLWRNGDFPFDQLIGKPYAHDDIAKAVAAMEERRGDQAGGRVLRPGRRFFHLTSRRERLLVPVRSWGCIV